MRNKHFMANAINLSMNMGIYSFIDSPFCHSNKWQTAGGTPVSEPRNIQSILFKE